MNNISFLDTKNKIEWTTFSDGSETCRIVPYVVEGAHGKSLVSSGKRVQIRFEDCTRDVVRLALVKDAMDRLGITDAELVLNYVPQARADRVFTSGNPLPLKVFCDLINSCCFKKVSILDPHSDVSPALLNNVEVFQQKSVVNAMLPVIKKHMETFTLCAPDLGATKKTFDVMQKLGHDTYYQAIKVRDTSTGEIVKCSLVEDTVEGNILIVDDCADGGATFMYLAKELKARGAKKVGLYVTHGIFAKGLEVLEKDVDFIFCSNIIGNYINNEDLWRFNER